jgi:hypothetical protein
MKKKRTLVLALATLAGALSAQQAHAFFGFFDNDDDYYPRHWRYGGPYGWGGPYGYGGPYGWGGGPYGWGGPYGYGYGYPYGYQNSTQQDEPPPPPPLPE